MSADHLGPRPAARGTARLVRGWLAAAVATGMAAVSHTWAGSSHHQHAGPEPLVLVLALVLAAPVCTALAGRALSWWRLIAAVSASQLLFHGLYSIGAQTSGVTITPRSTTSEVVGNAGHAGHTGHADHLSVSVEPGSNPVSALAGPASLPGADVAGADVAGATMVTAHLLAVVVTVLLLRRGEHAAEALVGLLMLRRPRVLLSSWRPMTPVRRRRPAFILTVPRLFSRVVATAGVRGPPSPAAYALCA